MEQGKRLQVGPLDMHLEPWDKLERQVVCKALPPELELHMVPWVGSYLLGMGQHCNLEFEAVGTLLLEGQQECMEGCSQEGRQG